MKRIYIFDVDNTLRSTNHQQILPQTKKLIKELSQNSDYILGYATGRGPAKIDVLGDLEEFFQFKVMVNGAIIIYKDELLLDESISIEDIEKVIKDTMSQNLSMGMVGFNNEAVTIFDDQVAYALKGYSTSKPKLDPKYYLNNKVYQLWIFNKDQSILSEIANRHTQFNSYFWHTGGIDLVYPHISKENAVKVIKDLYPEYQLICVGDGHNDFGMIKLADIGIIMSNSKWLAEIGDDADLIGPNVDEDNFYDFFKENNLL